MCYQLPTVNANLTLQSNPDDVGFKICNEISSVSFWKCFSVYCFLSNSIWGIQTILTLSSKFFLYGSCYVTLILYTQNKKSSRNACWHLTLPVFSLILFFLPSILVNFGFSVIFVNVIGTTSMFGTYWFVEEDKMYLQTYWSLRYLFDGIYKASCCWISYLNYGV